MNGTVEAQMGVFLSELSKCAEMEKTSGSDIGSLIGAILAGKGHRVEGARSARRAARNWGLGGALAGGIGSSLLLRDQGDKSRISELSRKHPVGAATASTIGGLAAGGAAGLSGAVRAGQKIRKRTLKEQNQINLIRRAMRRRFWR